MGAITNDGTICLSNQVYQQSTVIYGSGCFVTEEDSTIYIPNSLLSVDQNQNFYLKDSKSSIIVEALSAPQTFNVYGFGNGNKIGLTIPLLGNLLPYYPAYSYDESTGILTLRNLLLTQKFNIGKGYDSDLFKIVTDSGAGLPSTLLGSLQYNGPVPDQSLPSSCQVECKQLPDAPGTEPTEFTTTVTTTASDGSELTETGIVEVTTDSQGSWYTTTSIFPTASTSSSEVVSSTDESSTSSEATSSTESDVQTEFTSTWTTTNDDGSVETDSGIVSQSGTSFTTLTTFPPESIESTESDVQTEFTSTWTTTNDDGSVETDSGIVSQSGTSFTTLTTFPPESTESDVQTEFTSTWTTTNDDGSVETDSGIVSQSGTSFTTLTTFHLNLLNLLNLMSKLSSPPLGPPPTMTVLLKLILVLSANPAHHSPP